MASTSTLPEQQPSLGHPSSLSFGARSSKRGVSVRVQPRTAGHNCRASRQRSRAQSNKSAMDDLGNDSVRRAGQGSGCQLRLLPCLQSILRLVWARRGRDGHGRGERREQSECELALAAKANLRCHQLMANDHVAAAGQVQVVDHIL